MKSDDKAAWRRDEWGPRGYTIPGTQTYGSSKTGTLIVTTVLTSNLLRHYNHHRYPGDLDKKSVYCMQGAPFPRDRPCPDSVAP